MTAVMQRRHFITLLGGAAAAWPLPVRAQQGERVRRIGVLLSLEESDPEAKAQLSGFMQGLAELGWIEGRNLRMEVRWGGGDVDRIRTFAKDLVACSETHRRCRRAAATVGLRRHSGNCAMRFAYCALRTQSRAAQFVEPYDGGATSSPPPLA